MEIRRWRLGPPAVLTPAAALAKLVPDKSLMIDDRIWGLEFSERFRFPACSIKAGHPVYAVTSVFDMSGLSIMSHLASPYFMDILRTVMRIGNDYYPEQLGEPAICTTPGDLSIAIRRCTHYLPLA